MAVKNFIAARVAGRVQGSSGAVTIGGGFEVKAGVAKNDHAYNTAKFTAKGVEWIAGEWAKYQLREAA